MTGETSRRDAATRPVHASGWPDPLAAVLEATAERIPDRTDWIVREVAEGICYRVITRTAWIASPRTFPPQPTPFIDSGIPLRFETFGTAGDFMAAVEGWTEFPSGRLRESCATFNQEAVEGWVVRAIAECCTQAALEQLGRDDANALARLYEARRVDPLASLPPWEQMFCTGEVPNPLWTGLRLLAAPLLARIASMSMDQVRALGEAQARKSVEQEEAEECAREAEHQALAARVRAEVWPSITAAYVERFGLLPPEPYPPHVLRRIVALIGDLSLDLEVIWCLVDAVPALEALEGALMALLGDQAGFGLFIAAPAGPLPTPAGRRSAN